MPKKPTLKEIDEAIEVFELRIFDDKLNIQEEREQLRGDYGPQSAENAKISRERIKERQELTKEWREEIKQLKKLRSELYGNNGRATSGFRMRKDF